MVNLPPVGEVKASDRVAEDMKSSDSRACSVGHDFNVVFPAQCLVEEYAQVPNEGRVGDCDFAIGGVAEAYVGGEVAIKVRGPPCVAKNNQFAFVGVSAKAIMQ